MSIILENNFVKLALDKKTGAITELVNKKTGWNIIGSGRQVKK